MKFKNKQYIISDNDILMTGSDLSKNLHEVIQDHRNSINQLQQNLKWIYKYGGVGGNGGGSGSNSSWGFKATLNNIDINGETIILKEPGKYKLYIAIQRASKDVSYFCRCQYSSKLAERTFSLNESNGWRTELELELSGNDSIIIRVDNSVEELSASTNYITVPIIADNIILKKKNGESHPDISDFYISNSLGEQGLVSSVKCQMPIEGTKITYQWLINNQEVSVGDLDNKTSREQTITYEFPTEILTNPEKAGIYNIVLNLKVEITIGKEITEILIERLKTVSLIPDNLYLSLTPTNSQLYDEAIVENPMKSSVGTNLALEYRLYNGSNSNSYQEGIINFNINGENISQRSIKYLTNYQVSLTLGNGLVYIEEVNILTISVTIGNLTKTVTKYFFCKKGNDINWYLPGKNINNEFRSLYNPYGTVIDQNDPNTIYTKFPQQSEDNLTFFENCYIGRDNYYTSISLTNKASLNNNLRSYKGQSTSIDTCIHIGIQYSNVNEYEQPILKLYDSYLDPNVNIEQVPILVVYPEKIEYLSGNSYVNCNFFLKKEEDYNPKDNNKYNLISITSKFDRSVVGSSTQLDYREISVYINGVIEGTLQNLVPYNLSIARIEFCPSNYAINFIEQSFLEGSIGERYYSNKFTDVDITQFYYKYKATIIGTDGEELTKLISLNNTLNSSLIYENKETGQYDYSYSIENYQLKLNNFNIVNTMSQNSPIHSLMISLNKNISSGYTIFDWLNARIQNEADDNDSDIMVLDVRKLYYCGANEKIEENIINIPTNYYNSNVSFGIRLQGSSTLRYHSKNFILKLRSGDEENTEGYVPTFSPNFDPTDTTTYLPETEFTLKADAVDSSHSNNVSMGKFINDACNFNYLDNNSTTSYYSGHIKKCLTGFPTLTFLEVVDIDENGDEIKEYYYLGIYNFNLGRSSYNNLGYTDLNFRQSIDDSNNDIGSLKSSGKFIFSKCRGSGNTLSIKDNIIVAEIQGNNKNYDFHQTCESLLFKNEDVKDYGNYMFGEIVKGGNVTKSDAQEQIRRFVKSIAKSGGYIFQKIGKSFKDVNVVDIDEKYSGYNLIDKEKSSIGENLIEVKDGKGNVVYKYYDNNYVTFVPDVTKQYARDPLTGELSLADNAEDKITSEDLTEVNLRNCIFGNGGIINRSLNYDSLSYYYVICMAFGLVDSVQKNLNIKSWNAINNIGNNRDYITTFGIFFYDMDTCLGINNEGSYTNYFCFSDYWDELRETLENGEPGERVIRSEIIRDYYPITTDEGTSELGEGFDIPSSYLFSIIKYSASLLNTGDKKEVSSPQSLWANWRLNNGILKNAETFLNTYFKNHLSSLPESFLNLNYRAKYFIIEGENSNTQFSKSEFDAFKGTRINRTLDWLNKRFHLLDTYFNLSASQNIIYRNKENNSNIVEYTGDLPTNLGSNSDILILQDIFTNIPGGGISRNSAIIDLIIKAKELSPVSIKVANNSPQNFLLKDSNSYYKIPLVINGLQTVILGGSKLWTEISQKTLGSLINTLSTSNSPTFYINSNNLFTVSANTGTLTNATWNLEIPSIKEVKLNSLNYSGNLVIREDNNLNNLVTLDLSSSKICPNITNVKSLETVNMKNVSPGQSGSISFTDCYNLGEFNIELDKTVTGFENLEKLVFNQITLNPCVKLGNINNTLDFSHISAKVITITANNSNATNLTKFIINNDYSLSELNLINFNNVEIIGCTNLSKLNISIDRKSTYNNRGLCSIKINDCTSLEELTLDTTPDENDKIDLTILDLEGCSSLKNLYLVNQNSNTGKLTNYESLTELNLSETLVSKIDYLYKNTDGSISNSNIINTTNNFIYKYNSEDCLDLSVFPNIKDSSSLLITNNKSLVYIKAKNDKNDPFLLNKSIEGCIKLKRLLGCFKVTSDNVRLSNLLNFSIHGLGLESETKSGFIWGGKSIVSDGKVYMPIELVNKENIFIEDDLTKEYRHTNIIFNDSITNLDRFLYSTAITIFDIYYILNIIPEGIKNLSECFSLANGSSHEIGKAKDILNYLETIPAFNDNKHIWFFTEINTPNRNTFQRCNNVVGIYDIMNGRVKDGSYIKILSPEINENGEGSDNGLFSPLINVNSLNGLLTSYTKSSSTYQVSCWEFDNKALWRTKDSEYNYKINNLSYVFCGKLTDGNFKDFFKNLNNTLSFNQSFVLSNINFLDIKFYSKVTNIIWSFICNNDFIGSKGAILSLKQFFNNPEDVKSLVSIDSPNSQSFRSNNHILILHDKFFEDCDSLTTISSGGLKFKNTCFISTEDKPLPYDLLQPIKNKISTIPCLFKNSQAISIERIEDFCEFEEDSDSIKLIEGKDYKDIILSDEDENFNYKSIPELPYTLFNGCVNLVNISEFFSNFNFIKSANYYLSETKTTGDGKNTNFIDCSKLIDISYLFSRNNGSTRSSIISSIPNKLFYHGHTMGKKTLEGTRINNIPDETTEIEKIEINYKKYNSNIKSANNCFDNNVDLIEYYKKDIYTVDDFDENPEYQPFEYLYENKRWSKSPATKNNNKYSYIWCFDGYNIPDFSNLGDDIKDDNCEYLDNIKYVEPEFDDNSDTFGIYSFNEEGNMIRVLSPRNSLYNDRKGTNWNYLFTPDIFKYFGLGCNIDSFFKSQEKDITVIQTDNMFPAEDLVVKNNRSGRLCPYMLKPIQIGYSGSYLTKLNNLFQGIIKFNYYEIKNYIYYKVIQDGNGNKIVRELSEEELFNLTREERIRCIEVIDINLVDFELDTIIKTAILEIDSSENIKKESIENWIIPQNFFNYASFGTDTFSFVNMFSYCHFPNNPKLENLIPNTTKTGKYNLNNMFSNVTWDSWCRSYNSSEEKIYYRPNEIKNVFSNLYSSLSPRIQSAVNCFISTKKVRYYGQITSVPPSYLPCMEFDNVFPGGYTKINSIERFSFVFYGYDEKTKHEDPKTLTTLSDNHNYEYLKEG